MLTEGRLRHFSFPHALEELNGVVTFNASGIRLDDPGYTTPLNGKLGGGAVKFAGRIGFVGYELSEFDVTATGSDMRLRFPEGMRSVVDATLALQGPADGADPERHRYRQERELDPRVRHARPTCSR